VKIAWFALLLLFTAPAAFAEPIMAIGVNTVYETAADGRTIESKTPVSVRGGYRFEIADVFLEYTNFRSSSGTSMVYVSREHQELIAWARHILRPDWRFSPYAALGVGVQNDHIDTVLASQTSSDNGALQAMAAASAGVRARIYDQLDLQFEGRLAVSPEYAPNPLFGFGLAVGLSF
jgi:hypothetical protein